MKKSNLKLELYKLDEMPESWTLDGEESEIREGLEELESSDREILEKYKPADMAAQIARKLEALENIEPRVSEAERTETDNLIPFIRKLTTRVLIPAAAALMVIAFMLPLTLKSIRSTSDNGLEMTRIKGVEEPTLRVYRQSGTESEIMKTDSTAGHHDLLQLTYQVSGPAFGLIISVDGRGVVTKHLPELDDKAPRLTTGGEQSLPFSYELDDAPDFETFYLITSDQPFSTEAVMDITASAAAAGKYVLDIPQLIKKSNRDLTGKFRQFAVPIRKENSHE